MPSFSLSGSPPRPSSPPPGPISSFFSSVGQKVNAEHDRLVGEAAQHALNVVGKQLFRFIEDPYCPAPFKGWTQAVYQRVWAEIQGELHHETMRSFGRADLQDVAPSHGPIGSIREMKKVRRALSINAMRHQT